MLSQTRGGEALFATLQPFHSDGGTAFYSRILYSRILATAKMVSASELKEYYGYDDYIEDIGDIGFPLALGDDEYFVLGDNRNDSIDSRFAAIGPVKKEIIIGRASFRILPLNSIGSLKDQ